MKMEHKADSECFSKIHPDIFSTLKRFGMFGLTIPTEVMIWSCSASRIIFGLCLTAQRGWNVIQ